MRVVRRGRFNTYMIGIDEGGLPRYYKVLRGHGLPRIGCMGEGGMVTYVRRDKGLMGGIGVRSHT